MDFLSRVKKEMSEGIVRAILTQAGYRVIGLGVENVVREIECLTALEYAGLDFPKAMRSLPDLLVMDKHQKTKHLVEVKYRTKWDASIFDEIAEQTRLFHEVALVYLNANPPPTPSAKGPSTSMRCCMIRHREGQQEILLESYGEMQWTKRSDVKDHEGQWWGLVPIQSMFDQINGTKDEGTLTKAIQSLRGILDA